MSKQPSGNKQSKSKMSKMCAVLPKHGIQKNKKSKTIMFSIRKGLMNHLQANRSMDSIKERSTSKQQKVGEYTDMAVVNEARVIHDVIEETEEELIEANDFKYNEENHGGNDDSMDDVMEGLSQKEKALSRKKKARSQKKKALSQKKKALSKIREHLAKIEESLSENEEVILTKEEGFPQKKDQDFQKTEEIIEVKHIEDVTDDKTERLPQKEKILPQKDALPLITINSVPVKEDGLPHKQETEDEKKENKKLSQNIGEQEAVKNSLTVVFGHNLQEATMENVLFLGSGRKFDTCFNILKGDPRVKMTTGKDNEENKEEGQGEDKEKEKRPHNEEDASSLEYSIHLIKK